MPVKWMIFRKATTRAVNSVIFVLAALLSSCTRADASEFQVIYIEASEGNSSGGHFAVQLGNSVYHYQDDNGFIRLFKNNAEAFQADYRYRQNRSLNVAEIEVSDETLEILQSYFKTQYFLQRQHLNDIRNARNDAALLRAMLSVKDGNSNSILPPPENTLPLLGAGLFFEDPKSLRKTPPEISCNTAASSRKILPEIVARARERFGETFLSQKIASLQKQIKQLRPITNYPANNSSGRYAFSEQYKDLLTGFLALTALINHQPLAGNACFHLDAPDMKISYSGILKASSLQQQLNNTALSLLTSVRPDWGYALILTLARTVVLEHSLQTGRWTFLSDEDNTDEKDIISSEQMNLYSGTIKNRRFRDKEQLEKKIARFLQNRDGFERNYSSLEQAANRYRQWLISDRSGFLSAGNHHALPKLSIPAVAYIVTDLTSEQITGALHQVGMSEKHLLENDRHRNTYNLVTKNCVSALLELIDKAVSNQSGQRLGGTVDPNSNFIPFQAFAAVKNTYRVTETRRLPSYREERLARFYAEENGGVVFLRESNVFSSSVYKLNPDDAWFIFFTGDAVFPRPLFGAINLLTSSGQTAYGLTKWPFDGGVTLRTGIRGLLASLPELAFFNIRKGSYPYLMPAH